MKLFGSRSARGEALGTFGVAATSHWIASQVAMAVLERGGNAFDAAAAAGFVHQVVEPHQCGPGGDAVMALAPAGADGPTILCAQGVAPAGATIARYRDEGLSAVPSVGLLAAVVPGAVDGWLLMARDYGTVSLREVLEPAIGYAARGFPVYPRFLEVLRKGVRVFESEWPSSAAVYLARGRMPALGELFANPGLARTFERLLAAGLAAGGSREAQFDAARAAFSSGFVAEAVDAFCRTARVRADDGVPRGGLLTGQDMATWRATCEPSVSYAWGDLVVHKPGAWSQGPAMLQCLALLRDTDVGALDGAGAEFVHVLTEATKLAFADREAYYGDSGPPADVGYLLSEGYNRARRRLIGAHAALDPRPGDVPGRPCALPAFETGRPRPLRPAGAAALGAGDTCHIDVIDRWGNAVAATPSGGWLNDSPVIPELGFPLGTRAQMFWLQPGLASSLVPGRRPRTTLSPTIAYRAGEPVLAFGARGSDMQDQWILQFFLRHAACGWGLQEALDGPPFHSSHWPASIHPRAAAPNKLTIPADLPAAVAADLRRRGHDVHGAPDHEWNHSAAAARDGKLLAAASRGRIREASAVGR